MAWTDGIVCILDPDRAIAGTGFVVSRDGLIATCAHVVEQAGAGPGGTVAVRLRKHGTEHPAEVLRDGWRAPAAGDVAILRIADRPFAGDPGIPLGSSAGTTGHQVRTFGYPALGLIAGAPAAGEVLGETAEEGKPLLALRSGEITAGFSGAPVWDESRRRAIGMVASVARPDAVGRMTQTAFVIPAEALGEIYPALRLSDECPYRSLSPFTEDDAELFFGRESAVRELLEKLRGDPRFLAVLGPSGSGKSSLVQAGLVPALRRGESPGSDRWGVVVTRPADQPFDQLAERGFAVAAEGLTGAVRRWLEENGATTRLVLILDQFEEIFVICQDSIRQTFVTQLVDCLESGLPITVILILRDDLYGRLSHDAPELLPWLERGLKNVALALSEDELKAMVERPAAVLGWAFE